METISSEVSENSEGTALEQSVTATRVETHRVQPSLLRWLVGVIGVVILAILLILLARWIYHLAHHKSSSRPTSSQGSLAGSSRKQSSSTQNTAPNNPSSTPGSSNSSKTNSQITNTGPGDVVTIFVSASLVAGGLHFIWTLRRAQD